MLRGRDDVRFDLHALGEGIQRRVVIDDAVGSENSAEPHPIHGWGEARYDRPMTADVTLSHPGTLAQARPSDQTLRESVSCGIRSSATPTFWKCAG
jgi:hypothetical protein